ncbi:unnamed protein product [Tilletia controversa]|uniref:Uncharacterized protein n=3 Tax=Tilletia TaxID=13289 RepID=A0A8X7MLR1_9BASI|nr:hypothetical protein CF336_g7340 [Tilletia laevis]KAE8187289.1 hypothetical protein CF328_g6964 [Tilletia controversa]KAE8256788.1 hypothetical protein A4X03_0g5057 [Tilletia caries]KAE8189001.1 hypothetical protein CF335_g6738 [Tilletia laevis]KAE8240920.1 hypothetical protein A4X06_0g7732 [Tilletia controversa]
MSTRDITVRYHHSHKLSTGSATSTGTSSSSGSDSSTPPSSAQTHSHNPFRNRPRRPTTSGDSLSRKSPPNSPRSGFFRHKFHGETQTSSSSAGSSTLVSVELSRIESAGITPTQATFAPTQQSSHHVSQSWFHRRRHEDVDNDDAAGERDDADSDASFGCGLAADFDKHVDILRADPTSFPTSTLLPREPILAAAWKAKMSQADERQVWLDTVFFRLKARADGASGQELHNIHAPKPGAGVSSGSEKKTVGTETSDSAGKSSSADSFLDLARLINPCPRPGSVYLSKFAQERAAMANNRPSLTPKPSKMLNQGLPNASFSNFVFPPQAEPAGSSLMVAAPGAGATMNITPKAPQMQRFASSDQILVRGRAPSNAALRQTAMTNAAASIHSNQMQYGSVRGLPSQDVHSMYAAQLAMQQQQRGANRLATKVAPVPVRERSVSDAAKRHRPTHGGSSGDAPACMVPDLPDWAKQNNRTLHQSRQSGGSIGGDSVRSRQSQPTELPYFNSSASLEFLEPEPMARAVSHDTRLQPSRPTLLSRASSNSLRRARQPEALQISPVPGYLARSSPSYGVDMEVSLSSPGSIMTATGSASSRESSGSMHSHSTSGSSPLTPRTPEYYLAPLPVPHHQHHFPGAHIAGNCPFPLPTAGGKETMAGAGRITVVRSDALGSIELDAEDEAALLSGTGRFALTQGAPYSAMSKQQFLSPKSSASSSSSSSMSSSSSAASSSPPKQQPLLAPEELMPISRQLDFEAAAPAMASAGRSASIGLGPRQPEPQFPSHMGRCADAAPVQMTRPRANTIGTARLPLAQIQLQQ